MVRSARWVAGTVFLLGLAWGAGATEKDPEPPSLSALLAQERYAEAYEVADAQLKATPGDKELALTRARCLFMVGRFRQALAAAEALAKVVPERLDVADFRADCLFACFRPKDAVEAWKPLLDPKGWAGTALKKSAMALMAAGDESGARALLDARMPLARLAPEDLLLLSLRVFGSGMSRTTALEELIRRNPDSPEYGAELALAKALGERVPGEVIAPALPHRIKLKERYGEPSLEALLDGKRASYLAFDTGSQRMLLNRDTSRHLKLEPLATSLREGWGGVEPEAVSTVLLGSVRLGGLEMRTVFAQINQRDSEFWGKKAGYIGLAPFRPFVALYDRRGGFIEIHPPGTAAGPLLGEGGAVTVPVLWSSGLPLVPATVNGLSGLPFLLDTGAPHTLLDAALAARLGIRANSGKYSNRTGLGVSGAFSYAVAEDVRVEFGGVATLPPYAYLARVPQRFSVPCYGILGRDFLNRFRMVFDGPGGAVTLVRYP